MSPRLVWWVLGTAGAIKLAEVAPSWLGFGAAPEGEGEGGLGLDLPTILALGVVASLVLPAVLAMTRR